MDLEDAGSSKPVRKDLEAAGKAMTQMDLEDSPRTAAARVLSSIPSFSTAPCGPPNVYRRRKSKAVESPFLVMPPGEEPPSPSHPLQPPASPDSAAVGGSPRSRGARGPYKPRKPKVPVLMPGALPAASCAAGSPPLVPSAAVLFVQDTTTACAPCQPPPAAVAAPPVQQPPVLPPPTCVSHMMLPGATAAQAGMAMRFAPMQHGVPPSASPMPLTTAGPPPSSLMTRFAPSLSSPLGPTAVPPAIPPPHRPIGAGGQPPTFPLMPPPVAQTGQMMRPPLPQPPTFAMPSSAAANGAPPPLAPPPVAQMAAAPPMMLPNAPLPTAAAGPARKSSLSASFLPSFSM